MADRELAQKIVDVLERIRELDEPTLRRILHAQVEVDPAIAEDELLGVFCWAPGEGVTGRPARGTHSIAVHGILNAVCGLEGGRGVITARVSTAAGPHEPGTIESVYLGDEIHEAKEA